MKYLYTLFLLIAACSCAGNGVLPAPEDIPVVLQPGVTTASVSIPTSRSIVNDIGTGAGKISTAGIYVARTSDNTTYPGTLDAGSIFTAPQVSGQPWTTTSPVYVNTIEGRLYAWSPSTVTATPGTSGGAPTIPIAIAASQTFDGGNAYGCSVADYMYGAAGGAIGNTDAILVSRTASTPAIHLQHALAQVVFKMENATDRPAEPDYDYVWSIVCVGKEAADPPFYTAPSKTMSLADGSIAGKTAENTLTFECSANPQRSGSAGSPAVVAYGLVIPKDATTGMEYTMKVSLGNAAGTDTRTYQCSVGTAFSAAWQAGHRYTYNLKLGKKEVTIDTVTISGWEEANGGTEIDGGSMSPETGG